MGGSENTPASKSHSESTAGPTNDLTRIEGPSRKPADAPMNTPPQDPQADDDTIAFQSFTNEMVISDPPSARSNLLRAGTQFGRYLIKELLGKGAMGSVYLAHDSQLDRRVAIKIPSFRGGDWEETVHRFFREARAMANVHHPNLCPIYDVGQIDNRYYMSMAFIERRTLQKCMAEKEFNVRDFLDLIKTIAAALHIAHEAGIVHRDLKPANIMISDAGAPVIMDFGLAQRNQIGEADLTQEGAILGTLAFMAPEQAQFRNDDVGPQTDVWALGVILHRFLTDKLPFNGAPMVILSQIATQTPPSIRDLKPELPERLEEIVCQTIKPDLAERYESATAVSADLVEFIESLPKATAV